MMQFNIGLDFGTYQTKACILNIENDVHTFFRFPSTGTFFLPTRVALKTDGTFEYGATKNSLFKKEFFYFKIAAAEDEEFVTETFETIKLNKISSYDTENFFPFTPEFLSVIYLTYALFEIKKYCRENNVGNNKTGGILKRLFPATVKQQEIRFTTQIGIPTEWSQVKNLRRKRKFENILMIAEILQDRFGSLDSFLKAKSDDLVTAVEEIHCSNKFSNIEQLESALNKLGISVFPETAAGLTFIVKTRQLRSGYYAIMDIGGGSTDISFFHVEAGNNIKYLASESYIVAANNVYKEFTQKDSLASLRETEKNVQGMLTSKAWETNRELVAALDKVNKSLDKLTYKLFHRRVYHFKKGILGIYAEQPIILYGGGSRLPIINSGKVVIHDNGNPGSITIPLTYLEKQQIDRYSMVINAQPSYDIWKKDIALLVVALGLSYVKPANFTKWFGDKEYHAKDGTQRRNENLVAHPFNENYFIYDVLASRWISS